MKVVVMSAFRDSTPYLDRYFAQVDALRDAIADHELYLILGEGDSKDGTRQALTAYLGKHSGVMVDVACGGPRWESIVHPDRFAQLSGIWNKLFDALPNDTDAALIIESDLIWTGADIAKLVADLDMFPVIGGMVWLQQPQGIFYDIWAYRMGGDKFKQLSPWFPQYVTDTRFARVDSIGSVVAMRGKIATTFRIPPADVIVGFCNQIRGVGGSIWVDREVDIIHP